MLDDDLKYEIQSAYKTLASNTAGFRSRKAQLQMMAVVANTLGGDEKPNICVVEAGTGTGKTFGYLIPTIPLAKALKKKVVIATATVALQEQLYQRDLPSLKEKAELDFSHGLIKGRGRYLCLAELAQQTGYGDSQGDLLYDEDLNEVKATNESPLWNLREAFESGQWKGDRDSFPDPIEDIDWTRVSTDSRRCVGSRCRFINKCPYYQEKESQEEADVLVANHDLVLSDLKLGGGVILPDLEDVILIFDEGHALPEKAREHFAVRAPVKGSQTMLKQTRELMGRIEKQLKKENKAVEKAQHVATNSVSLEARMGEAYTAINSLVNSQPDLVNTNWEGKKSLRFPHGKVPESLQGMGEMISEEAMSCCKKMAQLKGDVVKAAEKGDLNHTEAEPMVSELGDLAGRMENLALLWKGYAETDPEKSIPRARWIDFTKFKNGIDYLVEVSSISLAQTLKNCLWDEIYGAVLTSATITELGEFHRYFEKTGLNLVGGVQTAKLESPFDFPNRGTLWIPQLQSLPNAEDHHVEEVSDILPQIVKEGEGTLVLFSSKRKLGKVVERLPSELLDMALIQGDMPKQRILREHKKRIEKGEGSVIFGLASFGEGVDLPGKLCTHVIIEKLPFAVPDSPIEATLSEYLASKGRNPFMEIAVPAVSIKLVQMMGRLIRTEDDYGLITLLDRRVLVKRYGQLLLNSLPEYRRQFDGMTTAA